ncbi:hypothetical protein SAMN05216272_11645 [Pseudomonas panipatensis]|uniref:Lipoprotein n=2 Tax=Pseudomonas panipatensis TaxID=428992 RepID=A0A1G8MQJ1_9PSED|nr:hypothetical protein SAMN05216272_11645 [Pseudomonas panipatensis]SMP77632.1 hypothetical protein SAMN06295951_11745 [Pseudomonas panipatensis]
MSRKPLLILPVLSLFAVLAGCAGPIPRANPSQALVRLGAQSPDQLVAESQDGKAPADVRYFELASGAHDLQVQLDKSGDDEPDQSICHATLHYDGFHAGEQYMLQESSLGKALRLDLYDAQGNALAPTAAFHCFPS